MPEPALEISGTSIVLVGSFNPRIFHPQWFLRQNLMSKAEADDADVKIVHPEICQFETERFYFQVTTDRLTAGTKPNATSEPLRDLILGTFYILEHTPVTALGINSQMHYGLVSEKAWHALGDKLAPKDGWNEVLEGRPGLRTLEILTAIESPKGSAIIVRVQPSVQVKLGAYFEVNAHFTAPETDGLKWLMDVLREKWEGSQAHAGKIARHILEWAGT